MIKNSEKKLHNLLQPITKGLSSHNPQLSVSLTMKAISSADKAYVISLLLSDHSIRKVGSITGLGKPTVGRIYQGLEMDMENYKGDRPSKLSPTDQRIVNQITTGKLDNAV